MPTQEQKIIDGINQLNEGQRIEYVKIVKGHIRACVKSGVALDNLLKIQLEAIEIVKLGDTTQAEQLPVNVRYQPRRNYRLDA